MFSLERITEENITRYEKTIPTGYHGEIKVGELYAIAVYDDGSLYGIMVSDVVDDWMYLVWFYIADEDSVMVKKASFFRYCIYQAKNEYHHRLKGAFIEIYPDNDYAKDIRDVLYMVGMSIREAKSNVFEFSLSQVEGVQSLIKAAEKMECRPLDKMSAAELSTIENMMQEDVRPIPVPTMMDWDSYISDISVFGFKNSAPCGALLFSMKSERLVAELAYAADPVALPAMLGTAYKKALEKYGEDVRVEVPVVVNKSENLVERIVPTATREDILEGVLLF